jgi:NAD(P)H-hydrate epimerase
MSGAAYFSAKAAYRTGAGLVQILTHEDNRIILQTQLPEAVLSTYSEENFNEDAISEVIDKADVIVVGIGLGQTALAANILALVLSVAEVPIIVDADALNIIAKKPSLFDGVSAPLIITPHMMEMARLCRTNVSEIMASAVDFAVEYAEKNSLICVLKDHETIVYDGTCDSQIYVNKSGNSGMATGGSGDVLTGIIAALVAQGLPLFDAATLGVYLHGLAGDAAADELGEYSVMASDIIEHISTVIKDCNY